MLETLCCYQAGLVSSLLLLLSSLGSVFLGNGLVPREEVADSDTMLTMPLRYSPDKTGVAFLPRVQLHALEDSVPPANPFCLLGLNIERRGRPGPHRSPSGSHAHPWVRDVRCKSMLDGNT